MFAGWPQGRMIDHVTRILGGGVSIGYTSYALMQNALISATIWRGEFICFKLA